MNQVLIDQAMTQAKSNKHFVVWDGDRIICQTCGAEKTATYSLPGDDNKATLDDLCPMPKK